MSDKFKPTEEEQETIARAQAAGNLPESSFVAPTGSAWERINAVMAEADKLEELTKLRMERSGETRESAFEWVKEMYHRYSPNGEVRHGGPDGSI